MLKAENLKRWMLTGNNSLETLQEVNIMSELAYVNLRPEHAEQLEALQKLVFPGVPDEMLFHADEFVHHARIFPEGTIVVLDGERVVGLGAGLLVDFDFEHPEHTLMSIMGDDGYYRNHNPNGAYYYGTDISVHPDYRRRGIGRRLYELRKDITRRLNKKGIIAGGVLPGFIHYMDRMSALEYVTRVVAGEIYDPTLSFQIENGFRVLGVLPDYFPHPASGGYASFIVWDNPDYQPMASFLFEKLPVRQHVDHSH